jgi:hypothetical protein
MVGVQEIQCLLDAYHLPLCHQSSIPL